jgi:hypothetical protein
LRKLRRFRDAQAVLEQLLGTGLASAAGRRPVALARARTHARPFQRCPGSRQERIVRAPEKQQAEEQAMSHVRIAVYTVTGGTVKEIEDRAREGMLPVFRGQSGFQAYGLALTQEGKVVSMTLWESGEQAQQANELAASWVKDNLADRVQLESAQIGDFLISTF